jgi:1,4-alpha-glucan branching enzyme
MGGEIAQGLEWSHERSVDWHLLGVDRHAGVQAWVRDLNRALAAEPALHLRDFEAGGFEWVDCSDWEGGVLAFLRHGGPSDPPVLVALNYTAVARPGYRLGVPRPGFWTEILNGDAREYGGDGWGNLGGVEAEAVPAHGRPWSLPLTLPPLAGVFLRAPAAAPAPDPAT